MATMMQEAERTRYLSEALNSSTLNWDSLVGDVAEALKAAEGSLEEMNFYEQVAQLAIVREGFIKWQKSLDNFRATEQQIRTAQSRKTSVLQKLIGMHGAAERITESSNSGDFLGPVQLKQILEELSNTVDDLINAFPEARPRPPAGYQYPSPPQQSSNILDWINDDTPRTDSARSENRGSPPPRRSTNSSYRQANSQPRRSNTRQSSTSDRPRTRPQYTTYFDRVTSFGNSKVDAGNWYETIEDAVDARQTGSTCYAGFEFHENSTGHLGHTIGQRPS